MNTNISSDVDLDKDKYNQMEKLTEENEKLQEHVNDLELAMNMSKIQNIVLKLARKMQN